MSGNVNLNGGANKAGQVRKLVPKQTLKTAVASGMASMADSIFNAGKGVAHNDATYSHDGKYTYSGTVPYEGTVADFENGKPAGEHTITGGAHWWESATMEYTGEVHYVGTTDTGKQGDFHYEGDIEHSGEVPNYTGTVQGTIDTDKEE